MKIVYILVVFCVQGSYFHQKGQPRIEILMLKLVHQENSMLFALIFGYPGQELQRFEDSVFTIHLYGIYCYLYLLKLI